MLSATPALARSEDAPRSTLAWKETLLTESVNPPENMKSAFGFVGSALKLRPRVVPWSKLTVPILKLPMDTLAVRLG